MKKIIAANLFRGSEAVGWRLHFEENAMIFKSHALNIQTGETTIAYKDIVDVQKKNTLGLVPNGMVVTLNDGTKHQFVIWHRVEVIAFIKEKAGLD